MKRQFGIDFEPPSDAPAPARASRMSDREALEKLHGKDSK
jgi:hypothetical protein